MNLQDRIGAFYSAGRVLLPGLGTARAAVAVLIQDGPYWEVDRHDHPAGARPRRRLLERDRSRASGRGSSTASRSHGPTGVSSSGSTRPHATFSAPN